MSHMLHSFQVCVFFLCFSSFIYSMKDDIPDNSKDQQEVEQENQLCNLSSHVLHHIASCFCEKGYIIDGKQHIYTRWKEINNLALACKYLDRTVTVPNSRIRINCMKKWKDQSCHDFLSRVYNLLERIVRRGGNNKIRLDLSGNELANDTSAFESFIKNCVTSSIVNQLTSLYLGLNGFTKLPENITKLRALRHLFVGTNQLCPAAIEQICTMTFLKGLSLNNCDLLKLPAAFKNLRGLHKLNLDRNPLTKEDLTLLESFSELRELHIGYTSLSNKDIIHSARYWKKMEKLYPSRFRLDEDLSEQFQALSPNMSICG